MIPSNSDLPGSVDALLRGDLVRVPADFSEQLVNMIGRDHDIYAALAPIQVAPAELTPRWQWLAIAATAALGIGQLIGFVFGMWAAVQPVKQGAKMTTSSAHPPHIASHGGRASRAEPGSPNAARSRAVW